MSKKLYKYVGSGFVDKVFSSDEYISLKCAYPKDFNDPYELFLTIDFKDRPEVLAFYKDIIGEIPQLPTTCFSRSPSVIPMWAHYAQNLQGFALEVDEEKLSSHFPKSGFGDVNYQDKPNDSIASTLYRAYEIGKPRYIYMLQGAVFNAAYYTKNSCWSYEIERRMIISEDESKQIDGLIVIEVPSDCVSSIIAGPRVSEQTAQILQLHAERIGCTYLDMKIGRSTSMPFFFDNQRTPHTFDGVSLSKCTAFCATCREPVNKDAEHCSWCLINEPHQLEAATRNTFRILEERGLLQAYLKDMDDITNSFKK